jgi:cold shock CspA family protein
MASSEQTGIVRSFDPRREGYGFITPDNTANGSSLFFHERETKGRRGFPKGTRVVFSIGSDHSGRPIAVRVRAT